MYSLCIPVFPSQKLLSSQKAKTMPVMSFLSSHSTYCILIQLNMLCIVDWKDIIPPKNEFWNHPSINHNLKGFISVNSRIYSKIGWIKKPNRINGKYTPDDFIYPTLITVNMISDLKEFIFIVLKIIIFHIHLVKRKYFIKWYGKIVKG